MSCALEGYTPFTKTVRLDMVVIWAGEGCSGMKSSDDVQCRSADDIQVLVLGLRPRARGAVDVKGARMTVLDSTRSSLIRWATCASAEAECIMTTQLILCRGGG